MSIKNSIRSLDFFSDLDDEQIASLIDFSSICSYHEEYVLYYEQTHSNKLIFLIEGLAKAYKMDKHSNEIFLYYIYPNSMLSEISETTNDSLYSFSNISFIEDSKILSIDYTYFKKSFLDTKILTMNFLEEVIKRSKSLEALINREFIFDAVSKVAMMINNDLDMFNKLKRHDISLILHIQPATLSRVLNRLKRNNIIDITQGKVSIVNGDNLQLLCGKWEDE